MKKTVLIFGAVMALTHAVASAQPAQPATAGQPQGQRRQRPAPDPRDMGGGRCADNPYNCADDAEPAASRDDRLDRRDDVDGRARRAQGRQDDGHHPDRRHRAQRTVARHRQAQLREPRQLRRHRAQAGQRALRAEHRVRARRRHRDEEQPHGQPGHDQHARRDVPRGADRRRAQPEAARLQEHHLHRRQRRQSGRPARRRRGAQQALRRRSRSSRTCRSTTPTTWSANT